jgi:hypothetical protein
MDIEDTDRYVLDVTNTLIANISFLAFGILIGIYIYIGGCFVVTFELEEIRLLGAIVWMMSTVKLLSWLSLPRLEYKPRLARNFDSE